MDHRTPEANRTSAAAAALSAFSASPAVHESPFSNFLSNLSPINTATTVSYTQRSFGTNLPTPPAVFTSPHANLLRQTSFVDRDDTVEAGLGVYKECNTSIVHNARSEEAQFCSPLGCVDEYLADPVEAYSKNPADLHLQPTNEVCQSLHTGFAPVKESITEVRDVVGSTENEALALTHEGEKDLPSSSLGKSQAEINQINGRTTRADINTNLAYRAQDRGENTAKLQTSGCQYDEQNGSGQSYEDSNVNKRKVLKGLVEEGGQNQRCIRRHLQFEAGKVFKHSILGNGERPYSLTPHSITNLKSLASHSDHRASSSPQVVSCATSKFLSYPYESVRSTQIGVSSNTSASIHSGIGLHLNHIARATPMSLDIFASNKSMGYPFIPEQMLEHDYSKNIAKHSSTSAVSGETCSLVVSCQQESQSVTEASSFTFHALGNKKPLCDSMNMVLVGQGAAPCEASLSASQYAAKVEELNQLSPRSNRRKAASIIEECKRCNCKRSKCLKLYCECFAAGVYCLDSCACENCYNKPEFEDTVLDVRQQIESRNPLAFTPKVVDNAIDCSANLKEEQNMTTPSSARHKRGCNCKKSKCLKKYCECYQAEVGCSSACRCEGCENKFGNKAERLYNKAWETHLAEKVDAAKGVDCMKAASMSHYSPTREGRSNISNFTPLSHPSSNTTSSASSTRRSSAKVRQAQIPSSKLQPSNTGRLHWGCSPAVVTPQLPERKGPQELQSDGASYDMPDDDTPEVLKDISNHTKVVKARSPNKKRVSPPQSRSQLRSTSPTGSRSGRKFTLHAVPSFPPLTPYRNSKEDIHETGNDDNVTSKNTWTTHMNLDEV